VADKLNDIFKNSREDFEKKWDDLNIFIKYGMLTEEKFYDKATKFCLFKNTDEKYFTFDEYRELIKENQTDKDGNVVYLYTTNKEEQHSFIQAAKEKGYDVAVLDGQLDTHFVNHLETKIEKSKFVRVDADVADKLIAKDEAIKSTFTTEEENELRPVFKSVVPSDANYDVTFEGLSETENPIVITQSEFMRRMKDMSKMGGGGMNFYGDLPDSYNIVVNTNHKLVKTVLEEEKNTLSKDLEEIYSELKAAEQKKEAIEKITKDKKDEEISQEEKDKLAEIDKKITEINSKKDEKLTAFGKENKLVKQLVDLALLSNNMLKGESLTNFVKRSVELIEK
jgi:molecular chaperone HtpG